MGYAHRACHGRQKVFLVQVEACVEAVKMQKPATNFAGDICRVAIRQHMHKETKIE